MSLPEYDPSQANFGECRVIRIKEILQDRVDFLNIALGRDSVTARFLNKNTWGGGVNTGHVKLGQQASSWIGMPDTNHTWANGWGGALRIRVFSSMAPNAQPFVRNGIEYIGQSANVSTWLTNVMAVFHPDAIKLEDGDRQTEVEELASQRVSDWLLAVLNNDFANQELYFPSKNIQTNPYYAEEVEGQPERQLLGYDRLTRCHITQAFKGPYEFGYGKDVRVAYCLHMIHQGQTDK